ncbi:MAG: type II toxin-antitoxin system VapC family toxin [Erythrobacter sp.]|nr:type II toxin-antitoxin system VapC family toxin [Erythrobacter sp.]
MILVDSSVWIDHLRATVPELNRVLLLGEVIQHGFVTAELALGSIAKRDQLIAGLAALPQIAPAAEDDLLGFVTEAALAGTGIGLVDAHLLNACHRHQHKLWTRDKRLRAQAERLGIAYPHS